MCRHESNFPLQTLRFGQCAGPRTLRALLAGYGAGLSVERPRHRLIWRLMDRRRTVIQLQGTLGLLFEKV